MSSSPIKSSFVSSQVDGLTQVFFHTFFYNTIFMMLFLEFALLENASCLTSAAKASMRKIVE